MDQKYIVSRKNIDFNNIHLLSDIHLGVRTNSIEWLDNIRCFFDRFYIPYLKNNVHDGDICIFCGDLYDSRQLLDIQVINTSIEIMDELSKILPIHIILGNHDCYKKIGVDVNSLVFYKYIPNVFVYETPTILTNGKIDLLLLPWIGDYSAEEKIIGENSVDYLFMHTEMKYFTMDNNKEINEGVDITKFTHLKRVFSGHIHKRQEMVNSKYIYVGSPYHTKRSDIGNKKGVYKLITETDDIIFTENNYSSIFQRLKLEDILGSTVSEVETMLDNNYTDILVPDKYINIFNMAKFVEILKDCKYKKIEIVSESKSLTLNLGDITDSSNIKDILSLLETNIYELGYDDETREKLKILNKSYHERSSKDNIDQ